MQRYNLAVLVEDEESGAGGALVNGTDESGRSAGRHDCGCVFGFAQCLTNNGREHSKAKKKERNKSGNTSEAGQTRHRLKLASLMLRLKRQCGELDSVGMRRGEVGSGGVSNK
ncbi:hypothetical protein J3458_005806 [Metarhizium acridum]|uniref:uncharacterized protein n=1 Tax=Metarhizium acridum TaxID=92637 RepID=UPI001C6BF3A9|nr:hypothetical protein J3458_005806 [Metarhizium acridum]